MSTQSTIMQQMRHALEELHTAANAEPETLANLYAGLLELEQTQVLGGWPMGAADAIMTALVAGGSHVLTWYTARGDRRVVRFGPWYLTSAGEPDWHLGPSVYRHEALEYSPSYADGLLPSLGLVSAWLPDGSYWDGKGGGLRASDWATTPTPRQLRAMVVEAARGRGELDLLERGVGMDVAAWVAAAPASVPMPRAPDEPRYEQPEPQQRTPPPPARVAASIAPPDRQPSSAAAGNLVTPAWIAAHTISGGVG